MPETEQEIFDSVLRDDAPVETPAQAEADKPEATPQEQHDGRQRDEKGRFVAAEEKPQTGATPGTVATIEAKPETVQTAEKPEDRERGEIPAWRLREEAEAKREALARAEKHAQEAEQTKRELAAMQQQLAQFQRQQQEQSTPPPDRYADPDGFDRYQSEQYQRGLRQQAIAFSEQLARVKFGDELYDKAEQELSRHVNVNPHDPVVHVIRNSSQPAFEVVKWFQQQEANKRLAGKSIDELLKEHGEKLLDDPAYLARAIEKAKATAKPVQTQANATIPSLNRTTAAASDNNGGQDESDAALFKSALNRT